MRFLDFMGDHPILAFFLAVVLAGMITSIVEAITRVPA